MAHARLSPSAAVRWMTCPGSIRLSEAMLRGDKGSKYATEGTAAHEMAERILLGADPASLVGTHAENGHEFSPEMLEDVMHYVNMVRDLVASTGGKLLVEQKLPIGHLTGEPDAKGTADCVVLAGDELIVADLKFGMGVQVDADQNAQLMIYALAALEAFCKTPEVDAVDDVGDLL